MSFLIYYSRFRYFSTLDYLCGIGCGVKSRVTSSPAQTPAVIAGRRTSFVLFYEMFAGINLIVFFIFLNNYLLEFHTLRDYFCYFDYYEEFKVVKKLYEYLKNKDTYILLLMYIFLSSFVL